MSEAAVVGSQEAVRGALFPPEYFGLSGIDKLRLSLSGYVGRPPISFLTGVRLTDVGVGSATFVLPITDWLLAPQGAVTVGVVAILADAALGCAIQTTSPGATGYTTTELSINMVRPVPHSGELIARARLLHGGRQLGLSEVYVTDEVGRLVAHGTSRCAIFPPDPSIGPPPAELPVAPTEDDSWTAPYMRPVQGAVIDEAHFQSHSGLDILRGIAAGELPRPPVAYLFGHSMAHADEGVCEFTMPASPWHASPTGFAQGGVTAFLADTTLGAAVQTTVAAGTAMAATDLRVQYLRPVVTDGKPIASRATVMHRGRGLAAARAELTNSEGKLVALATGAAVLPPNRRADLTTLTVD
jgi:uncharacterized protein (TIGR00369 family)